MDDGRQREEDRGLPPLGATFPHSTFYNNLMATNVNGNAEASTFSWSGFSGSTNDPSYNMGWTDFPTYAADSFVTQGNLPTDGNFHQNLDFLTSLNQPEALGDPNKQYTASYPGAVDGLNLNLDFMQAADSGHQLYEDASRQLSQSPPPVGTPPTAFTGRAYDPFGTTEMFPTVESVVLQQASIPQQQEIIPETVGPIFMETNPVAPPATSQPPPRPKPSYSEVTKHKLKAKEGAVKRDTSKGPPPVSSSAASVKSKKSSKSARLSRHHQVPMEPVVIRPDSRYGLDTFDDPSGIQKDKAQNRLCNSSGSSRKGSCSSIGSGFDEVTAEKLSGQPVNAYDIHGPGPGSGSKYSSKLGDIDRSSKPKETKEVRSTKSQDKKTKNVTKQASAKAFFDPKRIFSEKEGRHTSNHNNFIPNNQQNFHSEDVDSSLNSGKTAKSDWKTVSSNYINNDLRDSKKQTNTEARNLMGSYTENTRDEEKASGSQTKTKRSEHSSNTTSTKKSSSSTEASKHNSKKVKKDKSTNAKHLLGYWLTRLWEWTVWGFKGLLHLLWNLIKLVFSVSVLFAIVTWHYLCNVCSNGWQWLVAKIPFLNCYTSATGGSTSSNSKTRNSSAGLKENIALPSTGDEAMKRLLSCKGKDPYSILGLRTDATDEEIKRYYRRQAVLVHPDKNQQPGAEEAFKILRHAHELIGESEKRRQYDSQTMEAQETETAMNEFADLLTKLHDKMQEAANMMRCDHCGGKHKRVLSEWPAYSARFCSRCNIRHPAKEGDVWAESSVLGFLWHYYACMDGKVYDITEWASCQHESFKCLQANAHQVIYRISTGAGRHRNNSSRANEADLEDFLSNLFYHTGAPADDANFSGGVAQQRMPPQPPTKKGGRRRKRKH